MDRGRNALMAFVYIAAMVTANLLVWWLGPWFSPVNAFLLIGLDLTMRDVMHERLNRWQLAGVIAAGGVLTYLLNPSAAFIAIASTTAFVCAALADWAVYSALRPLPWMVRANGSNVAGALVDSILFPTIAFGFGAFLLPVVALQFVAKIAGGAAWSLILKPIVAIRESDA